MKNQRSPAWTGGERSGTEAVLFDFDMTLVDSSLGITYCLNRLAGSFGLDEVTREEVTSTIGHPMDKAMEMLWGRYEPAWMEYYRKHLVPLEYERIMPFPGTREALARLLDEGFSLGVVSNRKKLLRAVESAGLGEYFLSIVGMDDVENPKPHPESICLSMSNLGSTASGTTLVGDSEIDALPSSRRQREGPALMSFRVRGLWSSSKTFRNSPGSCLGGQEGVFSAGRGDKIKA